ncbi:hypothetical protein RW64_11720 [Geobacter sulfurreducens]|nr:hypothetical protein RW64_11720 [Geobacter sulfurreducens]
MQVQIRQTISPEYLEFQYRPHPVGKTTFSCFPLDKFSRLQISYQHLLNEPTEPKFQIFTELRYPANISRPPLGKLLRVGKGLIKSLRCDIEEQLMPYFTGHRCSSFNEFHLTP